MPALRAYKRALAIEFREPRIINEVILFCEDDGKLLMKALATLFVCCAVSFPCKLLLHDTNALAESLFVVAYVLLYLAPQALRDLLVTDIRDAF